MVRLAIIVLLSAPSVGIATEFWPSLIGGRQVVEGEYPEVIRISSGNSYCTATVIGPRVVLTAAHCTDEDGEIKPVSESGRYEFVLNQQVYKARCKIAPRYRDGDQGVGSQDIALCKTDRQVSVRYAIAAKEEPRVGDVATLIGYGCISRDGRGTGGNDGILRVGEAPVTRSSNQSSYHWYANGNSAICYGDSGGPAFLRVKNPRADYHYVAGVNSMGDMRSSSLLTSVPRSVDFMRDYEQSEDVGICGISIKCDEEEEENPISCGGELEGLRLSIDRLQQCLAR